MPTYTARNYAEAVNQLRQLDPDEHVQIEAFGQKADTTVRDAIVWAEKKQQQQQQVAPDDRVALLERRLGALEWSLGELEHQVKRDRRDRVDGATLRAAIEQMRGGAS